MRAVTARAYMLLAEVIAGLALLNIATEAIKDYLRQAAMLLQR